MRAAPTPRARNAIPVSPIPARTTATRKDPRRRAISRRGGTVSTKMTSNPRARRNTTTPYSPAAARSGRAAISRAMAALRIILWRPLQPMADVDRFAPSEFLHLAPTETSGPDPTNLGPLPHDDLLPRPNHAGAIPAQHRERGARRRKPA